MSYEPQVVLSDVLSQMRELTTAIKTDGHITEQSRLILHAFMAMIVNETHPAMFDDNEHELLEEAHEMAQMENSE
jgi:hypothetical protein